MKVAFWTLGLFSIGILGLVLINLFGNITVTNQLNYTTMKNAVESAMYDSINPVGGFCLCTDKSQESGKWVFSDDNEYELIDISYNNGRKTCVSSKRYCSIIDGQYRIDKNVFSESIIRRFAEMVGNNKDYKITIQDVVEYPPKVSVRVESHDSDYMPDEDDAGYDIVNQIDAILEVWGGKAKVVIDNLRTPTSPTYYVPSVTPSVSPRATASTSNGGGNLDGGCHGAGQIGGGSQRNHASYNACD